MFCYQSSRKAELVNLKLFEITFYKPWFKLIFWLWFSRYEWERNSSLHPWSDEHGGTVTVRLPVPNIQSVLHWKSSLPWIQTATTQPDSTQQGEEVRRNDLLIRVRRRCCRLIKRVRTQTTGRLGFFEDVRDFAINGRFWISVDVSYILETDKCILLELRSEFRINIWIARSLNLLMYISFFISFLYFICIMLY